MLLFHRKVILAQLGIAPKTSILALLQPSYSFTNRCASTKKRWEGQHVSGTRGCSSWWHWACQFPSCKLEWYSAAKKSVKKMRYLMCLWYLKSINCFLKVKWWTFALLLSLENFQGLFLEYMLICFLIWLFTSLPFGMKKKKKRIRCCLFYFYFFW